MKVNEKIGKRQNNKNQPPESYDLCADVIGYVFAASPSLLP